MLLLALCTLWLRLLLLQLLPLLGKEHRAWWAHRLAIRTQRQVLSLWATRLSLRRTLLIHGMLLTSHDVLLKPRLLLLLLVVHTWWTELAGHRTEWRLAGNAAGATDKVRRWSRPDVAFGVHRPVALGNGD